MDTTKRTAALTLAKQLIASHGIMSYMNKYHRDQLALPVDSSSTGFRYEFSMDPTINSWHGCNPTCTLFVGYNHNPAADRITGDGDKIADFALRITVGMSTTDMDVTMLRRRESMVSSIGMLCDILHASLPARLELTVETAKQIADRAATEREQNVSRSIMDHVGPLVLKGLVSGGSPRVVRLDEKYTSSMGTFPDPGVYRYRKVYATDRRGRAKDVRHYTLTVFASVDGRSVLVRRIKEK